MIHAAMAIHAPILPWWNLIICNVTDYYDWCLWKFHFRSIAYGGQHLKKSSFKPVFNEERRFPGEEDDDVEQVFPVRADGVAGHVGREVDVGPGDDVQKLAVVP